MGIPAGIKQTIPKPGEDEYHDQDRVRRMKGDDNVCNKMASWSNECYPSLTEMNMDEIVQSSACDIAKEWRQEHKRNDGVSDVIVFFKLRILSAFPMFLPIRGATWRPSDPTHVRYDGLWFSQHTFCNPINQPIDYSPHMLHRSRPL